MNKFRFIIFIGLLLGVRSMADTQQDVRDFLKQDGWTFDANVEINRPDGLDVVPLYVKTFPSSSSPIQFIAIHSLRDSRLWVGTRSQRYAVWGGDIVGISWALSTIRYSDYNIILATPNEIDRSVHGRFIDNPESIMKQRLLRNAFGPWTSSEARRITDVAFSGNNLTLVFDNQAYGKATLELAPGFQYLRSTVNGREVDRNTIIVGPVKNVSQVLQETEGAGTGASPVKASVFASAAETNPREPEDSHATQSPNQGQFAQAPDNISKTKADQQNIESESRSSIWLWVVGPICFLFIAGAAFLSLREKRDLGK